MQQFSIPAHVPKHLVVDVDIYAPPGGRDDPQLAWTRIGEDGPLAWTPRNGGHWIATDSSSVFELYRDAKHFSSRIISIPDIEGKDRLLPIGTDAPDHTIYRRNIMPAFTADAVGRLVTDARSLCVELIEELKPRGECEFVLDFAFRYPLGLFMKMVGLPDSDRMYLRRVAEPIGGDPDPAAKLAAFTQLEDYLEDAIRDRMANPRDDLITKVTQFKFGDRPYTLAEMRSTVTLLCTAGLDTVAGVVAFIAHHLARRPDHVQHIRERLSNVTEMHQIVQELLRRYTVVSMSRILAEDYLYKGIQLKAGDLVLMPTAVYNLDPKRIDRPEEVDFQRSNTKHISFGSGPHTCAGALLAREEIRIFLEEWLTRIPEFGLHPDHEPRMEALPLNQVNELWLQWLE